MANRKISFEFTPEDMKVIYKLWRKMQATQGKASFIAVVRSAIREAANK